MLIFTLNKSTTRKQDTVHHAGTCFNSVCRQNSWKSWHQSKSWFRIIVNNQDPTFRHNRILQALDAGLQKYWKVLLNRSFDLTKKTSKKWNWLWGWILQFLYNPVFREVLKLNGSVWFLLYHFLGIQFLVVLSWLWAKFSAVQFISSVAKLYGRFQQTMRHFILFFYSLPSKVESRDWCWGQRKCCSTLAFQTCYEILGSWFVKQWICWCYPAAAISSEVALKERLRSWIVSLICCITNQTNNSICCITNQTNNSRLSAFTVSK